MFNFRVLDGLKNGKQRIAYCNSELTLIGKGSTRQVYASDDNRVIKVAKNPKGNAQNKTEALLRVGDIEELFAPVYYSGHDYSWIISRRCTKVDAKLFRKYTGLGFYEFCRCAIHERVGAEYSRNQTEFDRLVGDGKNTFFNRFAAATSSIALGRIDSSLKRPWLTDTHRLSSWGLTREENPRLVLIDYGLVTE